MNKNCLQGIRCPSCGADNFITIETVGVMEGQSKASHFMATYTDDGFDNPLVAGDTEFAENGRAVCEGCGHQAKTETFFSKTE